MHLPSHEFELISISNGDQSDGHEEDDHQHQDSSYIVCAKKLLLKNTTFGPFKGEIIKEKEKEKQLKQQNSLPSLRNCCNGESNANVDGDDDGDDNDQNKKVNCNNKNTNNNNNTDLQSIIIHLKEEAANWLKILRNANSKDEANASVKVEGKLF